VIDTPQADWTSQLRRGVLELCILRIVSHEASYGYEIVTVYPLLRRLKAERHLDTFTVDSPAGPPRQYYRVTGQGQRRLAALEIEWDAMVHAVDRCVPPRRKGVAS
jgi:PadR family transcriptional regulator PadR